MSACHSMKNPDLLHMHHQEEYCNCIVISYSGAASPPCVPRHCNH